MPILHRSSKAYFCRLDEDDKLHVLLVNFWDWWRLHIAHHGEILQEMQNMYPSCRCTMSCRADVTILSLCGCLCFLACQPCQSAGLLTCMHIFIVKVFWSKHYHRTTAAHAHLLLRSFLSLTFGKDLHIGMLRQSCMTLGYKNGMA